MVQEEHDKNLYTLERALKRESGIRWILVALLALMTFAFMSKNTDTKTIMTPFGSEDDSRWVTKTQASQEYLRELTEKASDNAFVFNPKTVDTKFSKLLTMADPSSYGALDKHLIKTKAKVKKNNISSVFYPSEYKYNLATNDVVVTGILKTFSGDKAVDNEKRSYLFEYNVVNQTVTLVGFTNVSNVREPFKASIKD